MRKDVLISNRGKSDVNANSVKALGITVAFATLRWLGLTECCDPTLT